MKESTTGANSDQTPGQGAAWSKTQHTGLLRFVASGNYFACVRIKGKLFRKSLKTDVMSVALLRLRDYVKESSEMMGDDRAAQKGKMTFGDAVKVFRQRLDGQNDISEGAKVYRRKTVEALLKTWTGLEGTNVAKISKSDCLDWAKRFSDYSPTVYNNTVGTLRMILDITIEAGTRANNPAAFITKKKIIQRELTLPSPDQFEALVKVVETAGAWCSRDCADLIRFLAYGGFRKTEAANVTWGDCDMAAGQVRLRVTKNGKARSVPMIPEMKDLLQRLRTARKEESMETPVMRVRECQKAINSACKRTGVKRITHHDLRHLFATRCIESGVDIPTVSRWLGHKDGGALAMKVYGHLRNEHSQQMAQKVSFSMKPNADSNAQSAGIQATVIR